MVPVVAQIEPVIPVRPPAGTGEPSRQATNAAPTDPSAQVARSASPTVKVPRPTPATNNQELRLTVKTDTHEVIAVLVDTDTNAVIRQIPAEETRRAAEVIRAITGQLVDKVV